LSIFRTLSPFKSVKFHIAVTAPAVAVVAGLAGTVGALSAGAASQPAAIARPLAVSAAAREADPPPLIPPPSHAQFAQLDVFKTVKVHAKAVKLVRLTPRQIARRLLGRFHWSKGQFRFLDLLWSRESSWNVHADNPYTGAYGIPQADPGGKMSSAGPNWPNSARTQILWGMRYIKQEYGSPEAAWAHELATGWY
jgi:hypothetical protein